MIYAKILERPQRRRDEDNYPRGRSSDRIHHSFSFAENALPREGHREGERAIRSKKKKNYRTRGHNTFTDNFRELTRPTQAAPVSHKRLRSSTRELAAVKNSRGVGGGIPSRF